MRRAAGCAESTALPCRCVWWWRRHGRQRRRDYTQRQCEEQIRAQTPRTRLPLPIAFSASTNLGKAIEVVVLCLLRVKSDGVDEAEMG